MLEPALMLCIMLTIYCHLRAGESRTYAYTVLTGLSLGLAFLAKGPPAVLAVAVIVAFRGLAWLFPGTLARFRVSWGWLLAHLAGAVVVSLALLSAVDLWHYAVTGQSFFGQYFGVEWKATMLDEEKPNDPGTTCGSSPDTGRGCHSCFSAFRWSSGRRTGPRRRA